MNRWLVRLLIRDGADCHLCGQPVDISKNSGHLLGASQDHIVPNPFMKGPKRRVRTQKGAGDPANVRLAHRYCNSIRGQLPVTEELRSAIREKLLRKAEGMGGLKLFERFSGYYADWKKRYLMEENRRRREDNRLKRRKARDQ